MSKEPNGRRRCVPAMMLGLAVLCATSCRNEDKPPPAPEPPTEQAEPDARPPVDKAAEGEVWTDQPEGRPTPVPRRAGARKGPAMKLQITSTAFQAGQPIPRKYTGEGEDASPALAWAGVPAETDELVLICDDPDASTPQPWVHWVIYKIRGPATSLPEGVPAHAEVAQPSGARQGKNSWDTVGYRGPMPPPGHGLHHYHFKLYALDTELDLRAGATKEQVLQAMSGHVLAEGELIGTYERKK